jgi:hypothetical protein
MKTEQVKVVEIANSFAIFYLTRILPKWISMP